MADDRKADVRTVEIDDLRRCLATNFERLELTPVEANALAGLLVDSELRGHPDHGIAALGISADLYRFTWEQIVRMIKREAGTSGFRSLGIEQPGQAKIYHDELTHCPKATSNRDTL